MRLFASADRAVGTYTRDFAPPTWAKGVRLDVAYTAEGGAGSTLDFKIQYRNGAKDAWADLTGGSLVQFTGVADNDLTVYPGLTAVANRLVTQVPLPRQLRAVATVGTTSVTFAVEADFLA